MTAQTNAAGWHAPDSANARFLAHWLNNRTERGMRVGLCGERRRVWRPVDWYVDPTRVPRCAWCAIHAGQQPVIVIREFHRGKGMAWRAEIPRSDAVDAWGWAESTSLATIEDVARLAAERIGATVEIWRA